MEEFHAAYSQANLLYGLEMNPEDFEEIGLIAWERIGNKQVRLYRVSLDVDCVTKSAELPCNCDEIEAVTYGHEDWNYTSGTQVNGDYDSAVVEEHIEIRKAYQDPLYQSGKYVKYHRSGNTIYLEKDCGPINVLYKGIELDEDGLPYINSKEKDAIAAFCAYIVYNKLGIANSNQNYLKIAQEAKGDWARLCDAARVAPSISQNEFNRILDAKTTWNRKIFNKSYKPVK